jgi:hypothetical protein
MDQRKFVVPEEKIAEFCRRYSSLDSQNDTPGSNRLVITRAEFYQTENDHP